MTALIAVLSLILVTVVILQISRITELANRIRGEEEAFKRNNKISANLLLGFLGLFLLGCLFCAFHYNNYLLGFGPHESASEHGSSIDSIFLITTLVTGTVFVITQIALFYFAWKYQEQPGKKALFMPHDNKLEVIWTLIPAISMFVLVISGLVVWNEVMADVREGEEVLEIEATGMQFAWMIRYPGEDGKLGARDYKKINGVNPLGQIWEDRANLDDLRPSEIVLPVGKKVRVRITARDVLHNFFLPHFRVKMDAVPGMPTYFVFTPVKTTEQYREELSKYKEYQVPSDPSDPDSPMLWESFNYELACAELCGTGHFSMRTLVRIVEQEEYDEWIASQTPYYQSSIKGGAEDPYLLSVLPSEENTASEGENSVGSTVEGDLNNSLGSTF
jgi:cytochrome c oxidase subunit II